MPKDTSTSKSKAVTDLEAVTAMADRMGLKDKDRSQYISRHMSGFGHKRVTSWIDAEDDDDDSGDGGFFGKRTRKSDDDDDDF